MNQLEKLERLGRLHSDGVLTDAEFEAEKRRVLQGPFKRGVHRNWWMGAGAVLLLMAAALAWWLSQRQPRAGNEVANPPLLPQSTAPPVQTGTAPAPPPTVRSLGAAQQLAAAFRAAYGSANPATIRREGHTYQVRPAAIEWLGEVAVLITLAKIPDACHGCYGAIGLHYMRPRGSGFEQIEAWPLFVSGTSWGEATLNWSIRRDLSSHPMILSEGAFMGQGIVCEWVTLAELTPARPIDRGWVRTGYGNGGAVVDGEAEADLEGRIARPVRNRSFDVVYTGSDTFTERYMLRGSKYQVQGTSRFAELC